PKARGLEIIDDAGDQRIVRTDHDKIDSLLPAKRHDRGVVGEVDRYAFGLLGDAGVARRAPEPGGERRARDLPGQRMLAPAGAEEEDVHGGRSSKIRPPFRYAGSVIAA